MNILDRAIGFFDPEKAARRSRARLQLQASTSLMKRGYDAARVGRRANSWTMAGGSADAEIVGALSRIQYRSRELVRNNPYAARAIDILVANVIGTGITASIADEKVKAVWNAWAGTTQCDADGQNDFNGLQALAERTIEESGEVLVRFRPRRPEDGLVVPLQLQILEPDYIDTTKAENGIEYDLLGRRVAYWLFRQHPGAATNLKTIESARVPASEVLHIFQKKRPGQSRGVPRLAPVVTKLYDLNEYQEAALVKAKIEACFGVFVTRPDAGEITPLGPSETDSDGNRVESLEPGMTVYLQPGEKPEFANPSSAGAFEPYMLANLMAIASGIGITYDQLTGDLRQANYSSLRAGKIEFRRLVEQMQWLVFVPQLCQPIWQRFIEAATLGGALPSRKEGYAVKWQPPRHEPIDPMKDLTADKMAIRAGFMTLPQAIARNGYDPVEQFKEIAETNAAIDRLGLVLDSDPRKVSNAGLTQARPDGTVLPSPDVSEGD